MAEISPILDTAPTPILAKFCDDDERNAIARLELEHYQTNKQFLGLHHIVKHNAEMHRYKRIAKADPSIIINEIANAHKNITRYQSLLNNSKYKNEEERIKWIKHIEAAKSKLQVFENLIQQ